jgi:DNA-binding beta-propeller fold protein YncE
MALVLKDRVKETTTSVGTGTVTLAGAATGFQSFAAVGDGNATYYAIAGQTGNEWEVGVGTYTASGTTLSRTTVLSSSTGGTLVNFSAGTKDVFCTYPSEKSVYIDEAGILTLSENVISTGSIEGSSFVIPTNTTDAVLIKDDNLTAWAYSGKSFSVAGQESASAGMFFSPDGTRMYVIGSTGDDVNQYALSTAWDVTTASFVRVSAAIGETAPTGVFFKPDGTVMYVTGTTNDTIREFSVSTAWDVSTITFVRDFSFAAQDTAPSDIWFKPDGLKLYMTGTINDRVYEYDLATAWNVSTASFLQSFSVAAQDTAPQAVNFTSDGTRMYVLGGTGLDINRYTLSTPWDISTSVFFNNFYIGFQEVSPTGMFIDVSNDVAYVVGSSADTVFQYSTKTDGIELISSSGLFVEGSLYANKNLVVTSDSRLDSTLRVSGATTLSSTLTVGSTATFSAAVTASTTTSAINLGTSQTTGTFIVGGTAQTGAITVGQSTAAQTLNLATGATANAITKTINLGTAGVSGSTTNINIGSAVVGATSSTTINGNLTATLTEVNGGTF